MDTHIGFSINDVRLKIIESTHDRFKKFLDYSVMATEVIRVRVRDEHNPEWEGADYIYITFSEGGQLINLTMHSDDVHNAVVNISMRNLYHQELDSTAEQVFHGIQAMLGVINSR